MKGVSINLLTFAFLWCKVHNSVSYLCTELFKKKKTVWQTLNALHWNLKNTYLILFFIIWDWIFKYWYSKSVIDSNIMLQGSVLTCLPCCWCGWRPWSGPSCHSSTLAGELGLEVWVCQSINLFQLFYANNFF